MTAHNPTKKPGPGIPGQHPDHPPLPPPLQILHCRTTSASRGSAAPPHRPIDHDEPGNLSDEDALTLKEIRAASPELDAATGHVRDFATMMRDLTGSELPAWIERVENDNLPALHSLLNGLRRDQDAVIAGLSSSWNSGQVEGQNTRVKRSKRDG
ncbi:transposase [Streptomyces sp. NPDC127190]|uniref:transposase n=1 Tax=unclassified Streptomyces TaxID=2593676 RepID=UPI00363ED387